MRPPMCLICHRSLGDDLPFSSFKLVRFALTPEEEAVEREQAREGWTGHPSWEEWFCDEHTALAEEHSHLHWREAMALLAQQRKPPGRMR
ncbi:hypothetical protein ACQPZP_28545 [Spirillospora sp. CA-142024]|uniref:hypothetical protein n=1 Tax=Spirillospora sp. CA-142024 TaxID=3240036 RepID=UPI003D93AD7F